MNISSLSNLIKVITSTSNNVNYIQSKILDLAFSGSFLPKEIPSPETWETLRLDEVCEYIQRGKSPKYDEKGEVRVVSQKCVQWSGFNPEHSRYIENSTIEKYTQDRFLRDSDILWNSTGTGTVGRTCIFTSNNDQRKYVADSHVTVLRSSRVFPKFLLYWTRSPKIQDKVLGLTTGSTNQQELNLSTIKSLEISFPSLKYQVLLANHIDGLITLCEELDTCMKASQEMLSKARKSSVDAISTAQTQEEFDIAWNRIHQNWYLIADTPEGVDSIRDLIRELAVRGVLTDKHHKSKFPAHKKNEGLFDIPASWEWIKLGDVVEFVNGFAFRSDEYTASGVGVVRMSDLKSGQIVPDHMKYVSLERLSSLAESFQVKPGDIVMGMTGATLGKPCVNRTTRTFLLNQRIGKFVPKQINPEYLILVLSYLEKSFMNLSFGTGVNNLSTQQIKDSLIPLPPNDEQGKIVDTVSALFSICDCLEMGIVDKQQISQQFARSIVSASI